MTTAELIILAKRIAVQHGLDPALVCAMVEQESSWDPYAIRPESESGFMVRYGANYNVIVRKSASKRDDKWIRFEDVFYASIGLMQTMYCVVIETFPDQTEKLRYPTTLCDPEIGLAQGCRLFAHYLKQKNGNVNAALLRWNGGGDPDYPTKVLVRKPKYL